MDCQEKTLDCLILGILKRDPSCDLTYMSEQLKLPKTEIMKRIRYLCQNDYLIFSDNGFYTTIHGDYLAVSPDSVSHSECLYLDKSTDLDFDWENYTYIPTPKSFSAKKK